MKAPLTKWQMSAFALDDFCGRFFCNGTAWTRHWARGPTPPLTCLGVGHWLGSNNAGHWYLLPISEAFYVSCVWTLTKISASWMQPKGILQNNPCLGGKWQKVLWIFAGATNTWLAGKGWFLLDASKIVQQQFTANTLERANHPTVDHVDVVVPTAHLRQWVGLDSKCEGQRWAGDIC